MAALATLPQMSRRISKRHRLAKDTLPKAELLGSADIAAIYRTTASAIRTALWRHRKLSIEARIPQPLPGNGHRWWLRSAVEKHLMSLEALNTLDRAREHAERAGDKALSAPKNGRRP